jgi:hypothetical protein
MPIKPSEEELAKRVYKGDLIEMRIVSSYPHFNLPAAPRDRFGKRPKDRKVVLKTNVTYYGIVAEKYRMSRSRKTSKTNWENHIPGQKIDWTPIIKTETFFLYHILLDDVVVLLDSRELRYSGMNAFNFELRAIQRGTPTCKQKKRDQSVSG